MGNYVHDVPDAQVEIKWQRLIRFKMANLANANGPGRVEEDA